MINKIVSIIILVFVLTGCSYNKQSVPVGVYGGKQNNQRVYYVVKKLMVKSGDADPQDNSVSIINRYFIYMSNCANGGSSSSCSTERHEVDLAEYQKYKNGDRHNGQH